MGIRRCLYFDRGLLLESNLSNTEGDALMVVAVPAVALTQGSDDLGISLVGQVISVCRLTS